MFSPIGKKYALFSQLTLFRKLQKKSLKFFPLRHAPPQYIKFHLGKNINQEGGGKIDKYNLYTLK